jgi:hypothetical protein
MPPVGGNGRIVSAGAARTGDTRTTNSFDYSSSRKEYRQPLCRFPDSKFSSQTVRERQSAGICRTLEAVIATVSRAGAKRADLRMTEKHKE